MFSGNRDINSNGTDTLDDYMTSLGTSMDKTTRTQIRRKVFEMKKVLESDHTAQIMGFPVNLDHA